MYLKTLKELSGLRNILGCATPATMKLVTQASKQALHYTRDELLAIPGDKHDYIQDGWAIKGFSVTRDNILVVTLKALWRDGRGSVVSSVGKNSQMILVQNFKTDQKLIPLTPQQAAFVGKGITPIQPEKTLFLFPTVYWGTQEDVQRIKSDFPLAIQ